MSHGHTGALFTSHTSHFSGHIPPEGNNLAPHTSHKLAHTSHIPRHTRHPSPVTRVTSHRHGIPRVQYRALRVTGISVQSNMMRTRDSARQRETLRDMAGQRGTAVAEI